MVDNVIPAKTQEAVQQYSFQLALYGSASLPTW